MNTSTYGGSGYYNDPIAGNVDFNGQGAAGYK